MSDSSNVSNVGGGSGQDEKGVLPNATAVLVLGIMSIVGCVLYGIVGLICGIIALILHKRNKEVYATNPIKYAASWENARAGYVCAIIGVSISALYFIYFMIAFIIVASVVSVAL
ncbi:MAG: CCC motif membrane protein [Crocinitomicaceae bacterium]|nr:CCC motif membrane protein [Crocinitomicaceae bacterium]MDG1777274.1 CCC motif membrane protein [Crocinitomicaceae bacterium]